VNALHDIDQRLLQLLLLPRDARRVLAYLEARDGDAAGIRRLAGGKQDLCALNTCTPSRLVGMLAPLGHRDATVIDQRFCVLAIELILGRAGHGKVASHTPRALALVKLCTLEFLDVVGPRLRGGKLTSASAAVRRTTRCRQPL
jgi:hypothetical protein